MSRNPSSYFFKFLLIAAAIYGVSIAFADDPYRNIPKPTPIKLPSNFVPAPAAACRYELKDGGKSFVILDESGGILRKVMLDSSKDKDTKSQKSIEVASTFADVRREGKCATTPRQDCSSGAMKMDRDSDSSGNLPTPIGTMYFDKEILPSQNIVLFHLRQAGICD